MLQRSQVLLKSIHVNYIESMQDILRQHIEKIVTLTDQEYPTDEDKHWFAVSGAIPGGSWSVDPELINRPGNNSRVKADC